MGVGWETIECVGDVVNDSRPESNLGLNICCRAAHLQGEFRERSPLRQLASAFLHAITIVRPFIHSQRRRRAALMGSLPRAPHSPRPSMISLHRHPPIRPMIRMRTLARPTLSLTRLFVIPEWNPRSSPMFEWGRKCEEHKKERMSLLPFPFTPLQQLCPSPRH